MLEQTQVGHSRRTVLRAGGIASLGLALTIGAGTPRSVAEQRLSKPGNGTKLNVLFIGAHPDDEASTLAALGQWKERFGARSGVITVTRGEGGGNAVGLEEGPPLGLLREAEERLAVGTAGIDDVFNLDGLDFYYTASAPLSHQVWGGDDVLERIVRVVRATRPEIIVTMNPSAVEGNHGNHQQAAMFAVEAYLFAGDPEKFPEQRKEGLQPWTPLRLFRSGANGKGTTGPGAISAGYAPTIASDVVFGCWNGTVSATGQRWSEIMVKAQREYVTQGWAEFADPPSDPDKIPATWLTTLLSRGPLANPTSGDDAALLGAVRQAKGGLPLGSRIEVRPRRHAAVIGLEESIDVTVSAPASGALPQARAKLSVPPGWSVSKAQDLGTLASGRSKTATFTVTAPSNAAPGTHVQVWAEVTSKHGAGRGMAPLRVAGAVEATIVPLPEIAQFRAWTKRLNIQHLDALVPELFAVPSGRTRALGIQVENHGKSDASGTVAVELPAGFGVEPAQRSFSGLRGGASSTLDFTARNSDASIPVANTAPNAGVWPVQIKATVGNQTVSRSVVMNLVPSGTVPAISASPTVDAVWDAAKYPGDKLDISAVWDGAKTTPEDVSGSAWISRSGENFLVFVDVVDDIRGTILPASDNKRQRRTDSVEIYFDPRGTAANTAQTLILGIMPSMDSMTGAPGVGRDRDNYQGEARVTAPGVRVAVKMAGTQDAYRGYQLEALIPFSVLPDRVDPARMGFNVVINDSDTQNKAAQTRTAWSTYPGMRADPWRWGELSVPGLSDRGSQPVAPRLPDTAAASVESPQSILQSALGGVPLGGHAALEGGVQRLEVRARGRSIDVDFSSRTGGTARAYLWDGSTVRGQRISQVPTGRTRMTLGSDIPVGRGWMVLVSLEKGGLVAAAARPLSQRD
ncbi:GlcNAc-PI de-N-acetylase [Galactobacter valiniphilus]|uniref:GlcNAc-PI de-N-acetylase n=1 Tax=Galactobacter valiniphilus TaxID=2676122 RepID=A0A399JF86_9MICC|nr:GlcNAc-PI de-N-acetylase [Galactobacter valiniphilus]